MSKYHNAFQGFVKIFTGAKQPGVKGSSTTIIGTKPNVGNLKKNKETFDKLKKITDTYVVKAGKVDPGLKKALRDSGSKSLQKTDKILRKNKKDGGRMGLKGGGSDMSSTKNQSINSLKNFLEDRKNRKKSKIPTGTYAYMKRDRSPKEVDRVMSKLKSDAQAMGGDFKSVSELKPLKGESKKSFKSRPSTKFLNKGGRAGLKDGSKKSGFGAQSVKYGLDKNYGVTKADKIAKFVSKKNKKKII